MGQRLLAVLLVGLAAIVAAGGGAYLALRQSAARPGPVETLSDRQAAQSTPAPLMSRVPEAEPKAQVSAGRDVPAPGSPPRVTPPASQDRPFRPAGRAGSSSVPAQQASAAQVASPKNSQSTVLDGPAPSLAIPEAPIPAVQVPSVPAPIAALPPQPELVDLSVPAESVIGLQIVNSLSSDRARLEDRVDARVTRDVRAGGQVAIPAGSRMEGIVTVAERGGKIRERARLAVRFHTLVLPDGTRVPVQTDTIYREGESPAAESGAKIGGAAVGGALLGAILGGGKGAAIGGSIGAASGTAMVMAGDRNAAVLPAGSSVTVRLHAPVTITVER
jgi:hypothetical protein